MEAKSVFDIPEEVFEQSVFHLLQFNDILRLRRVCKWTKSLSEDYFRRHPRPQRPIYIDLKNPADDEDESESKDPATAAFSLKSFLDKDSISSIRIPSSRFRLGCSSPNYQHPLLSNFLQRYGKRMKHVMDLNIAIPLREKEFEFFRQVHSMKSATLRLFQTDPKIERGSLTFPECFKTIQHLHLFGSFQADEQDGSYIWELIDHCRELRSLRIIEDGPFYPNIDRQITMLADILDRKQHENLRSLELIPLQAIEELDPECEAMVMTLIRKLCGLAVKHQLRLMNLHACLVANLAKREIEDVASCLVSLATTTENLDFKGVPLPNLEEIQGLAWPHEEEDDARILGNFTSSLFPRLTRLDITIGDGGSLQVTSMEHVWAEFPNLEEVRILYANCGDQEQESDDWSLFGSNVEAPAFLKLQKLRKLTLDFITKPRLSDNIFIHIIRHLKLHEFHLISAEPVDSFTGGGIGTLLSGPFRLTIEHFPFEDWNLAELTDDEFQLLGREFPCNKPV